MNVNNNLQGMQQLLSSQEVSSPAGKTEGSGAQPVQGSADQATLSAAASVAAAASATPDSDVRMEKVAAIQQALASGTYNIPASEVAGKMMDHMLGK
jgi:negative regulator of flagellin synthesis FlgM